MTVYMKPNEIWPYFRANGKSLEFNFVTLAETRWSSVQMTAEDGELTLCYDSAEDYFAETCLDAEEAEQKYAVMLEALAGETEEPADPEPADPDLPPAFDEMDEFRAAAFAFCGVVLGESPDDAGLNEEDLDEVVFQLAWFLKGRHGLEPLID